jgi:hypothetical protein
MTFALESDALRATVSPARGEVRSLVWRATGEELLFQAPWSPAPTRPALRAEDDWVASWPGGWTLLFPNAGNRCEHDGRDHGFHGAASLADWAVDGTALSWEDASGLAVRREIALDGAELSVATAIENRAAVERPYVLVEHLVLGAALGGPGARLSLGGAQVRRMADDGTPLGDEPWPTDAGWDAVPDAPFSRFGALHGLEQRAVTVARDGLAATVRWSGLPAMWLWHEHRASDGFPLPITALGLEPASAPRAGGLAAGVADGSATVLAPGERATLRVALSVAAA